MIVQNGLMVVELHMHGVVLRPTLVWDENDAVLFDTGMPGQTEQLLRAIEEAGIPFERVKAVVLTHQDLDHVGGLPELLRRAQHRIKVWAHAADRPHIEGALPLLKTDPNRMSPEAWAALPESMQSLYKDPPKSKVDDLIEDGMRLPWCGGIAAIHTPGHTDGHLSFFLERSRTLVAGDALVAKDGVLHGPAARTTPNIDEAYDSLQKLIPLAMERIVCYHGGLVEREPAKQIERLIASRTDHS